jgi:hypothetical protein
MARIYQTRQRSKDKRFDMTVSSDDEGWCHPIGYCAGWKDLSDEEYKKTFSWAGEEMIARFKADHEKLRPFQAKYHDDGHETREQAAACYREYEFDNELHFHELRDEQRKCAVCDAWTQGYASLGEFHRFYLCDAHKNREGVEQALAKLKE